MKQSNTFKTIFNEERMKEMFGNDFSFKTFPNSTQRTAIFFEKWMEWRPNRMMLKRGTKPTTVKKTCKDLGLQELFDFQCRSGEIRFADKTTMAFARLNGLQQFEK